MAGRYTNENTYRSVLCVEYSGIIANFESKGADQNEFLINDALEYAKLNLGITHLLFEKGTDKLLSFITLGMGTLKIPDEIDWELKGKRLKEYPKVFPNQFPALKIGQLATQKEEENRGVASLLISFAIRLALAYQKEVGCKYIVLDADPRQVKVYEKRGFKTWIRDFGGRETIPMYLELP